MAATSRAGQALPLALNASSDRAGDPPCFAGCVSARLLRVPASGSDLRLPPFASPAYSPSSPAASKAAEWLSNGCHVTSFPSRNWNTAALSDS
jgi:hypothetical protein